jgi:hypothetical protein
MGEGLNKLDLTNCTIYINDELCEDLKISEMSLEPVEEFTDGDIKYTLNSDASFTATARWNLCTLLQLIGVWQCIIDNCPKRVVHLMKYGKKRRTRYKNYRRACRILEKLNKGADTNEQK